MFIRSERLFLRPLWPEDWQEVLSGIADEGVVRNLARAPWPYSAEDARDFARRPQDWRLPHFLVTWPAATGPALTIGCVGLGEHQGEVELGYWLARPFWGRGFAAEAARGVLRLARVLGHNRVTAGHFIDNPASGRVLRKIGFRPTGQTRRRFSLARGAEVESIDYRIELGEACDCNNPMPMPMPCRAA